LAVDFRDQEMREHGREAAAQERKDGEKNNRIRSYLKGD